MTKSPYSLPEIYEIAFSFRDYKQACDFITDTSQSAGLSDINAMVELGCGPGQYCLEFAKRDVVTFGLDNCPEMVRYLNKKAKVNNLNCRGIEADFRNFKLPQKVDLAICMMDTFSHLLTNYDTIDHFNAVADNLTSDGVYLIELTHPKDFLTPEKSATNIWMIEKDGIKVSTDWGSNAVLDPLSEIVESKVVIDIERNGKKEKYETVTQTRLYSAGLIRSLIELSGRFTIVSIYGDLNINQPFNNTSKSWRMILVLRKFE